MPFKPFQAYGEVGRSFSIKGVISGKISYFQRLRSVDSAKDTYYLRESRIFTDFPHKKLQQMEFLPIQKAGETR